MSYRVTIPERDGARVVRDFIAQWVQNPGLRTLVESSGGHWPGGPLSERIERLHEFSDRWDFRAGAERLDLSASGRHDGELVMQAAEQLGLTAADRPTDTAYDHAAVLGGTALASIYRVRRLADLRGDGLAIGRAAVLTALREIGDGERQLVSSRHDIAALVQDATTEFDVMANAVTHFTHATPDVRWNPNENPHLAGASARIGDTLVLAAPSADPQRRANTRDNYDVYAKEIAPRDTVLVVTSSIYLPYQFFVALQALGWDAPRTIEAVGFPPEWMQGVLTGPENVLQETRSALFGAMKTLELLDAERNS